MGFRGYVERFGEAPSCAVGLHRDNSRCDRVAVMEVYDLPMCEDHGEEAASAALEELAHHLEEELQRQSNPYVRALNPDLARALETAASGFETSVEPERADAALLRAFPLDRDATCGETVAYVNDPDANGRGRRESPSDAWRHDRMVICRHMRLAFEEDAHWLVETLEEDREQIARQAAYALALEREAGLL